MFTTKVLRLPLGSMEVVESVQYCVPSFYLDCQATLYQIKAGDLPRQYSALDDYQESRWTPSRREDR
jgi:hypothetical protein